MSDQKTIDQFSESELQDIRANALKQIIDLQGKLSQAQQTVTTVEIELDKRKKEVKVEEKKK
jgi:hypothetical protein